MMGLSTLPPGRLVGMGVLCCIAIGWYGYIPNELNTGAADSALGDVNARRLLEVGGDFCDSGLHNCAPEAFCFSAPGSFNCECPHGYIGDGTSCIDINECTSTSACPEGAECINQLGGYQCMCPPGYEDNGYGVCEDSDECSDGTHDCSNAGGWCVNADGSYFCTCRHGFCGDGLTCDDVDECAGGLNRCDAHATCINEIGSYECVCNEGYGGDGFECESDVQPPLNECTQGTHSCHNFAACEDLAQGYSCDCNLGYSGDGFFCEDIDECTDYEHPCDSTTYCHNVVGDYECLCLDWYFPCHCDEVDLYKELAMLHNGDATPEDFQHNPVDDGSFTHTWDELHPICSPEFVFTAEYYTVSEAEGELVVHVLRRNARADNIDVPVWTTVYPSDKGDDATPGVDFEDVSTALHFEGGDVTKTLRIAIFSDGVNEGPEVFYVNLPTATHEVIISDN